MHVPGWVPNSTAKNRSKNECTSLNFFAKNWKARKRRTWSQVQIRSKLGPKQVRGEGLRGGQGWRVGPAGVALGKSAEYWFAAI